MIKLLRYSKLASIFLIFIISCSFHILKVQAKTYEVGPGECCGYSLPDCWVCEGSSCAVDPRGCGGPCGWMEGCGGICEAVDPCAGLSCGQSGCGTHCDAGCPHSYPPACNITISPPSPKKGETYTLNRTLCDSYTDSCGGTASCSGSGVNCTYSCYAANDYGCPTNCNVSRSFHPVNSAPTLNNFTGPTDIYKNEDNGPYEADYADTDACEGRLKYRYTVSSCTGTFDYGSAESAGSGWYYTTGLSGTLSATFKPSKDQCGSCTLKVEVMDNDLATASLTKTVTIVNRTPEAVSIDGNSDPIKSCGYTKSYTLIAKDLDGDTLRLNTFSSQCGSEGSGSFTPALNSNFSTSGQVDQTLGLTFTPPTNFPSAYSSNRNCTIGGFKVIDACSAVSTSSSAKILTVQPTYTLNVDVVKGSFAHHNCPSSGFAGAGDSVSGVGITMSLGAGIDAPFNDYTFDPSVDVATSGSGRVTFREVPIPNSYGSSDSNAAVNLAMTSRYANSTADPCDRYAFSCVGVNGSYTSPPGGTRDASPHVWDATNYGSSAIGVSYPSGSIQTCGSKTVELAQAEQYRTSWSTILNGDAYTSKLSNIFDCSDKIGQAARPDTGFSFLSFISTDDNKKTYLRSESSDVPSIEGLFTQGGYAKSLTVTNPSHRSRWLSLMNFSPSGLGNFGSSTKGAVSEGTDFEIPSSVSVDKVKVLYINAGPGDDYTIDNTAHSVSVSGGDLVLVTNANVHLAKGIGFPYSYTTNPAGDDVIPNYTTSANPNINISIVSAGTVTVDSNDPTDYQCGQPGWPVCGSGEVPNTPEFYGLSIPIILRGPIIAKGDIQLERSIGTGQRTYNDSYPADAIKYDAKILYDVASSERDNLSTGLFTGLTIYDVQWEYSN